MIIAHVSAIIAHTFRAPEKRDPKWPAFRRHFLEDHPICMACNRIHET